VQAEEFACAMRATLVVSTLAALATGLGGALIAFFPRLTRNFYDTLLGFSAGVMLGAGSITLLGPALHQNGLAAVAGGLLCGAVLVLLMERGVPHLEPHFAPQVCGPDKRLGMLMAAALTLHHVPEGLAMGVSFAGGAPRLGFIVAAAVALQNIPEGLAVALPLRAAGLSRGRAIWWAAISGMAEPLAAVLGVLFVRLVGPMVPFALAVAAGAMIFVASDQLIPESRQQPHAKAPSLGLICGFLLVAVLTKLFAFPSSS
jgi:ZIP family zinc transporter